MPRQSRFASVCGAVIVLASVPFARNAFAVQDALSVSIGTAAPGSVATVPVYVRDVSGTPLGSDAGTGNRIQALSFKVTYPAASITSIAFSRGGVLTGLSPVFESSIPSAGAFSYLVSFSEAAAPIPFTLNVVAPGNLIGTLQVSVAASTPALSTINLTIDSTTASLSNQGGTIDETVANGALATASGSISVTAPPFGAPGSFVATAVSTSEVDMTWLPVQNVARYEVYREPALFLGNTTALTFADKTAAPATTYFYYVRAISTGAQVSPNSSVDAATTVIFTDDPLTAGTIVKALHLTELRTAINAYRVAVNLPPVSFAPAAVTGSIITAAQIQDLRNALPVAMTYTDSPLVAGVPIKAIHIRELRSAVK